MKTVIFHKEKRKVLTTQEVQARNILLKFSDQGRLIPISLTSGHLEDLSEIYSAITYNNQD
jgi:hypothetical protein